MYHATYGDADSVEELFTTVTAPDDVAAIVVEPVLGEGGYIVPPPDFLPRLRAIADRHGILLVFDEVQSGMGRTGKMFAAEHTGVVPDIVLLAKGIASGMPLGAMIAQQRGHDLAGGQPRLDDRGQPGGDRRRAGDDRPARARAGARTRRASATC